MIGDNYNNNLEFRIQNSEKAGQVLLIIIMLLATIITVVLAVTFRSTTDTQLTKLEQDNQTALAAAQAGIEEALRTGLGVPDISTLNVPAGFNGSATVSTESKQSFITPILQANEQYTFYLTDYTNGALGVNSNTTKPLLLYLQSETGCPAAEITFITSAPGVEKFLVDPCSLVTNGTGTNVLDTDGPPTVYTPTGESIPFKYKTKSGELSYTTEKLMIIRVLFSSSRVGVVSTGVNPLPTQGKTVISEVRAPSGVTKKILLFQSYPQIPADFFVTSF